MTQRVANREMGSCVNRREEFVNNNRSVFAQWLDEPVRYVVYSYGTHFPMYVWENGVWYGNGDKYSVTTSRHQSQCRPVSSNITWLEQHNMLCVARLGFTALVKERLNVDQ